MARLKVVVVVVWFGCSSTSLFRFGRFVVTACWQRHSIAPAETRIESGLTGAVGSSSDSSESLGLAHLFERWPIKRQIASAADRLVRN